MEEEQFVYFWSYMVPADRQNDHSDHGHSIYTEKQIEDFKNSKLELCFEIAKYVEVELTPVDIKFERICSKIEYDNNELAQKLCCFNNIIGRFEEYYADHHDEEDDDEEKDDDNEDD